MRLFATAVSDALASGTFGRIHCLRVVPSVGAAIALCDREDGITIDGQDYQGTRNGLVIPTIRYGVGLDARRYAIEMPAGIPAVENLVRGQLAARAAVAIDTAILAADGAYVGAIPLFRGFGLSVAWRHGAGEAPAASLRVVSQIDELADTIDLRKTDADHSQRVVGGNPDRFRRYGSVARVEAE